MPYTFRGRKYDVDGEGIATVETPGLPTSTVVQVPKTRVEKLCAKLDVRIAQLTAQRDRLQAKIDQLTSDKAGLDGVVAAVTSDP